MTQTRSAILRTMPRSWVMNSMRHAEPRLELLQQLEDLRLDGDVERGGRLVGDQEVGLVGERHGDHHALALAARELMRIALEPARRIGNADLAEQLDDARARGRSLDAAVQLENLADLLLDRVQRIERGHRLLEDDGDVVAAHVADLALRQAEQLPAFEMDGAGRMARRRIGQQLEDRQRRHRLAGARFADQRHRLALLDLERDAIDREHLALALAERDREVADGEKGLPSRLPERLARVEGVAHRLADEDQAATASSPR